MSPPPASKPVVSSLTRALERASPIWLACYAIAAAFLTYFCMYAFRRPFAAGSYGGDGNLFTGLPGLALTVKSVFVLSQGIGYMLSKYLGTKICSETQRADVSRRLVILIWLGWLSLVLFGLLPGEWKALALLLNGLPLGMVWGMIVRMLEGRRTTEMLVVGLSTSYILAGGWVKSAGSAILNAGWASEAWMPAVVATLFLPMYLAGAWMLGQIPAPDAEDVRERVEREVMDGTRRRHFVRTFLPGLVLLAMVFLLLTAYRDYRDNFQADMFREMGAGKDSRIFILSETPVALAVTLALVALSFIRDNRRALVTAYALMFLGMVLLAGATVLYQSGRMNGPLWMMMTGMGVYLAYVPFGAVVLERTIAYTRYPGTAVFAISLIDAIGYTGSVGLTIGKDVFAGAAGRLDFFIRFSWFMAVAGALLIPATLWYFLRQGSESNRPRISL